MNEPEHVAGGVFACICRNAASAERTESDFVEATVPVAFHFPEEGAARSRLTKGSTTVSTNSNEPIVWLTQEAYDRLNNELTFLSGPGRAEIVARIEQARSEGDLKENGGYHAAREEQGKAEARILYLKDLLRRAHVGEAPADDGVVEPGMLVVANIAGDETTFLFGSREVAGDTDLEVYSEQSPIGVAVHGAKVGDKLTYAAPNGRDIKVEILSAKPFSA